MAVVPLTTDVIAELTAALNEYQQLSADGATSLGSGGFDDVIANSSRTASASQTTPWTPLFLPIPPGVDVNGEVTKQLASNGIAPILTVLLERYIALRALVVGGGGGGAGNDYAAMLADSGPVNAPYVSGAYRVETGGVFPSAVTWWTSNAMTMKIVSKTITRDGSQNPTVEVWQFYDPADGTTVLKTVTDTISYSGVIETSRTRVIVP